VLIRSGGPAEGETPSLTLDAPLVVIGRGEGCDVRLPDPSVSHRHATIRQRGTEHILIDEGSTNGTYIGSVRLGAQAPRILRTGELVRVGRVWLEVRFESAVASTHSPVATKELALALVARALAVQGEAGGPCIKTVGGPDAGKELFVDEPGRAYVIGRGKGADLAIDDTNASRRHVQVVRRGDQLLARDLGSKNGATLGGTPLPTDRDRTWTPGEQLAIGDDRFEFEHPAADALRELEQAADEKIRFDEVLDPPVFPRAADGNSARDEAENAASTAANAPGSPVAPVTAVPASPKAIRARSRSGWTSADVAVVLLAVGVLGLSILGLIWLLRTG
jgi:pSer/pThr/pTyr-binding forkhead associated (FHA) protein